MPPIPNRRSESVPRDQLPEPLRPFRFHGVDLQWVPGRSQAHAECPFCGKDKWYCKAATGQWDCKACAASGNVHSFLAQLLEYARDGHSTKYAEELAAERRLLDKQTVLDWGMGLSPTTGDWLVPGYGDKGQLVNLYRYVETAKGMRALFSTPGCHHGLLWADYDDKKPAVWVCEGVWDGMALWEVLRQGKYDEVTGGYTHANSVQHSEWAKVNVVAVPGLTAFLPSWKQLWQGKHVTLLYDNDHPKEGQGGRVVPPAGTAGMRKLAGNLLGGPRPHPSSVSYLCWGDEGHDPDLPSGTDVRDVLTEGLPEIRGRLAALGTLAARVEEVPEEWVADPDDHDAQLIECADWTRLRSAWQKAFTWSDGLDVTLSVMLAAVVSTEQAGDQLWVKVVAPPSSGKSVLAEALSTNKRFVLAKSIVRGFHSGYDDGEGGNCSPLLEMNGKTLVVKDGDTLLKAPNRDKILAEARDVYDRVTRSSYLNKKGMSHEGLNITFILLGTESLRELDTSELGERFLDVVAVESVTRESERAIAIGRARRAMQELGMTCNGKPESREVPTLNEAKQLTGGYVSYLRENAGRLLQGLHWPDETFVRCTDYGELVSFLRARPSPKQEESTQRELCVRLTSQFTRLAGCLAAVLGRPSVDGEVMRRVRKVALDTARGQTLRLCGKLYAAGEEGLESEAVAHQCGEKVQKVRTFLHFLKKIGAVELHGVTKQRGFRPRPHWRLTERLRDLYERVVEGNV